MSPSYILFLFGFKDKYIAEKNGYEDILKFILNNIDNIIIAFILFFVAMSLILKLILISQYINSTTDRVGNENVNLFEERNLKELNSGVVSFILGNILPAVILVGNSPKITFIAFLITQIILYILIMNSSDMFPNLLLIIQGMNLGTTKKNDYVFTFKSTKYEEFKVYQIGDTYKSKMYIAMYKKT
ncbi:hypothetical protein BG261_06415 [Floricoccus tropicus]|uniref:Uncharacterized protein n=2 Tax=Floricoccus tropicus TaxID=1859473 RepID=A0A1E8GKN4_9LACT|nr:hypothetical protein BG261_06415 [Floricoccus tropicus]